MSYGLGYGAFALGATELSGGEGEPTTVRTADGQSYTIPSGPVGSYPWVRQANLLAVAYRQLGDPTKAAQWDRQYQTRVEIWNRVLAGEDTAAVVKQFVMDIITAPFAIVADIGGAVITTGRTALGLVNWVPILLVVALIVIGIGLHKGSLRAELRR